MADFAVQVTCHPLIWQFHSASRGAVEVACSVMQAPLSFLQDHVVLGQPTLPAAAMLEMTMAAGKVRAWQREVHVLMLM